MNLSFEVEVLTNIKGELSTIYYCILIKLPRKSAAFLPLLNLPVETLLEKFMPQWGKSALFKENFR